MFHISHRCYGGDFTGRLYTHEIGFQTWTCLAVTKLLDIGFVIWLLHYLVIYWSVFFVWHIILLQKIKGKWPYRWKQLKTENCKNAATPLWWHVVRFLKDFLHLKSRGMARSRVQTNPSQAIKQIVQTTVLHSSIVFTGYTVPTC